VTDAIVNGQRTNLARYIKQHGWDTTLPLVADYNGSAINVSFQVVDADAGVVLIYAPVLPETEYRLAAPVADYPTAFAEAVHAEGMEPYAGLEGKRTGDVTGPMTFGEIAYVLLNQTTVHLAVS
jgi:hypothetical protein